MQCYHFLAATIAVAKTVDSIPGTEHQLPYGVIANWMVENDIDTDKLLNASPEAIEIQIKPLLQNNQPHLN